MLPFGLCPFNDMPWQRVKARMKNSLPDRLGFKEKGGKKVLCPQKIVMCSWQIEVICFTPMSLIIEKVLIDKDSLLQIYQMWKLNQRHSNPISIVIFDFLMLFPCRDSGGRWDWHCLIDVSLHFFRCSDIRANFLKEISPHHHLLFIAAKSFLGWRWVQCSQGTWGCDFQHHLWKVWHFHVLWYSLPWSCCDSGERFPRGHHTLPDSLDECFATFVSYWIPLSLGYGYGSQLPCIQSTLPLKENDR